MNKINLKCANIFFAKIKIDLCRYHFNRKITNILFCSKFNAILNFSAENNTKYTSVSVYAIDSI